MNIMKLFFIFGVFVIVTISSVMIFDINSSENNITFFQPEFVLTASAQEIPNIEFDTTPCIDIFTEREKIGISFETPHLLPYDFKLKHVEKHAVMDIVTLLISPGDECNEYNDNVSDGTIIVWTSIKDNTRGDLAFEENTKKRLLNYNHNDHYRFFKINGMFAWGYDPGLVDDTYMHPNGTIIETKKVTYPGRVTFTGNDLDTFNILRGYYTLDDLKRIAESFR